MVRRSVAWEEGLAEDMRNPDFAREFLMATMEEEVPLQVALGITIRAYGVKEFAARVGMAPSTVQRAINPRHNPTLDTINRLLAPFKLRLSLTPITPPKRKRKAA